MTKMVLSLVTLSRYTVGLSFKTIFLVKVKHEVTLRTVKYIQLCVLSDTQVHIDL